MSSSRSKNKRVRSASLGAWLPTRRYTSASRSRSPAHAPEGRAVSIHDGSRASRASGVGWESGTGDSSAPALEF